MRQERIVVGLAVVFGALTGLLLVLSVALLQPVLLVVAVPVATAAIIFSYQASGSFAARVRRERPGAGLGTGSATDAGSGGFGAGPRQGYRSPRGRRARARANRRRRSGPGGRTRRGPDDAAGRGPGGSAAAPGGPSDMTRAEACRRLDLDADADQREVKRAYHEKVKEVHPDRGGDAEEFKAVAAAYERLSE